MNGDFNFKGNVINREGNVKNYIYTGSQILNNSAFYGKKIEPFSMNSVWDFLIQKKKLLGVKSNQEFLHVTNLKIYKQLLKQRFKT